MGKTMKFSLSIHFHGCSCCSSWSPPQTPPTQSPCGWPCTVWQATCWLYRRLPPTMDQSSTMQETSLGLIVTGACTCSTPPGTWISPLTPGASSASLSCSPPLVTISCTTCSLLSTILSWSFSTPHCMKLSSSLEKSLTTNLS